MPLKGRGGSGDGRKGIVGTGGDAVQLTIDYVKQETLGPLKATGRFLAAGVAATTLFSAASILGLVGVLRLLQDETGLTGNLSWIPYLVVVGLGAVIMGVAVLRITAGPGARRLPGAERALAEDSTQGGS